MLPRAWPATPIDMRATDLRRAVRAQLVAAGIASADAEAGVIVADVLGVTPAVLPLVDEATAEQVARCEAVASRRAGREPLQHLLGWAGFRRLTLEVGPGVFVPRPETEVLVDVALAALDEVRDSPISGASPPIAVDLCAGSGAIALALADESPGTRAYAVERERAAFGWLERNVAALTGRLAEVDSMVVTVHADATADPLPQLAGQVHLVVSNPPYIPHGCVPRDPEVARFDPAAALYGGSDGLDVVRGICATAARLLHPGGVLAIEHGELQGSLAEGDPGVPAVLRESGDFEALRVVDDLTGRPRVTVARRRGVS